LPKAAVASPYLKVNRYHEGIAGQGSHEQIPLSVNTGLSGVGKHTPLLMPIMNGEHPSMQPSAINQHRLASIHKTRQCCACRPSAAVVPLLNKLNMPPLQQDKPSKQHTPADACKHQLAPIQISSDRVMIKLCNLHWYDTTLS
jgi:hypothetical protein